MMRVSLLIEADDEGESIDEVVSEKKFMIGDYALLKPPYFSSTLYI